MTTPHPETPTLEVDDRVVLTLAKETDRGTVLALTSDCTLAAVEWDRGAAHWHDVRFLTRVGGRIRVKLELCSALCVKCDTAFGIPIHLDGHPFVCPYGHRNLPEAAVGGEPR